MTQPIKSIKVEDVQHDLAAAYKVLRILNDKGVIGVDDQLLRFLETAGESETIAALVARDLARPTI